MRGLPAGWYLEPARATLEASAIFGCSWQFVCHVADLPAPGTAARFDCGGRSAFVLRTRAGDLRAFRNACRHRGSRLVDGDPNTGFAFCVDARVRCPYHGWVYDDLGQLEAIPDGQRFDLLAAADRALAPLPVEQWRGLVFVAFDAARPAAEPGPALDDWPDVTTLRRLAEPRTVVVGADWKLACEHALDTAHLGVARASPRSRVFEPTGFAAAGADAVRAAGIPVDATRASWPARAYQRFAPDALASLQADFLFIWPNLLLVRGGDTLTVLQVLPGPPGACRLRTLRYGPPDVTRATRVLRYLHERVVRQALADDARLLERVQHGLASVDAAATSCVDDAQPGLRWFVERCRHALEPATIAPAPDVPRSRTRRARKPSSELPA